jgi:hypothetical protein
MISPICSPFDFSEDKSRLHEITMLPMSMRVSLLPGFKQLNDSQKIWYRRCVLDTILVSASQFPTIKAGHNMEDAKTRDREEQ